MPMQNQNVDVDMRHGHDGVTQEQQRGGVICDLVAGRLALMNSAITSGCSPALRRAAMLTGMAPMRPITKTFSAVPTATRPALILRFQFPARNNATITSDSTRPSGQGNMFREARPTTSRKNHLAGGRAPDGTRPSQPCCVPYSMSRCACRPRPPGDTPEVDGPNPEADRLGN